MKHQTNLEVISLAVSAADSDNFLVELTMADNEDIDDAVESVSLVLTLPKKSGVSLEHLQIAVLKKAIQSLDLRAGEIVASLERH